MKKHSYVYRLYKQDYETTNRRQPPMKGGKLSRAASLIVNQVLHSSDVSNNIQSAMSHLQLDEHGRLPFDGFKVRNGKAPLGAVTAMILFDAGAVARNLQRMQRQGYSLHTYGGRGVIGRNK